jgi:putative redox protein
MRQVEVSTAQGKFGQTVRIGPHVFTGDEPAESGGDDRGPAPHELLLAALATCTSMTVRLYADRKGWPVESVTVRVSGERQGDVYRISREVGLRGELSAEQRARLLEIAGKCPVHRTLTGEILIESSLADAALSPA